MNTREFIQSVPHCPDQRNVYDGSSSCIHRRNHTQRRLSLVSRISEESTHPANISELRWARIVLSVVLTIYATAVVQGQGLSISELDRLGHEAFDTGKYEEAAGCFRLAVERAESEDAPASTRLVLMGNLAEQLRLAGRYDESETWFDRAVQILRTHSPEKSYAPVVLANRGRMYQESGKYTSAESSLTEAYRLAEVDLGRQHPLMVQVLSFLGVLYTDTGKWEKAEKDFTKAIALEEKQPAGKDATLAPILANMAVLYERQGKWKLAEALLVRALPMAKRGLGPEHPGTARSSEQPRPRILPSRQLV